MLGIEVKGGRIEYDPEAGLWQRVIEHGVRQQINKNPFDQVNKSMHQIKTMLQKVFSAELPFTYSFAMAFPEGRFSGALPANITPEQILDCDKCTDIKASLDRLFASQKRWSHPPLDPRRMEMIRSTLMPHYQVIPVLWRQIEKQEEQLRRLTADQGLLLNMLTQHRKAAIRGVAGSGKTLLALSKAQELARSGQRTLFLCFNRLLKEWIEETVSDAFGDQLVVDTYHGLITRLCEEAQVPFSTENMAGKSEFWNEQASEFLIRACERLPLERKFDALVVDEGQDFRELWWLSLEDVFRSPGDKAAYYVFFDPTQALFVEDAVIPEELGQPYDLPVNCRNTVRIARHCSNIVQQNIRVKAGAPDGDDPLIMKKKTLKEAFAEAGKQVRGWCMPRQGGLKMSQVAVLAPAYSEPLWPKDFQTIAGTRKFEEWRRAGGVLLTTWGRFKGLEADAVVIIEGQGSKSIREAANRYVAYSRAKHLLTVIEVEEE
jgi:hypothetical protein